MTIQDKITFFYALEETIWNEKVEANPYFGTLSILIVALSGALVGGDNILYAWFGWEMKISLIGTIGACLYLWGLNVGESIVATNTALTALLRSLLILAVMAGAFGLGYVASAIVIGIVCLILTILFFVFLFMMLFGTGKTSILQNTLTEEKTKVKDMGMMGHVDGSGNAFDRNLDGSFSKRG